MCRFTAYIGPKIPLERVVVLPVHSLLEQSHNATEAKLAVNGDGFGVAWYAEQVRPGLYRDVLPAWSDGNLTDFCRLVESRLFLAHVRASTIGRTLRVNCHPFTFGAWSFMHNGRIGDFLRIRRALEESLPDALYHACQGTTDSELLFLLLLSHGLEHDPYAAIQRTVQHIVDLQGSGIEPTRLTCALSDGARVIAFRHSSDRRSPSLYVGREAGAGGHVVASEPIDGLPHAWEPVAEGTILTVDGIVQRVQTLAA
ncbi:class II glutamine amidotransferase [Actibacterium sp. 188UL27-1]|uniref:class II glutamine amidotransferase n=1 Tax=Actibacterium sp. 188UL27-1 TaxID=2786961 RepID=UPI00195B2940|nr:class II glutamine amidotransferase [Actibacterium sp. 188UL27-1]MBM7066030.1 class II glutamine amidotransferase [Actibacterium sp. 188UL27-1]